MPVEVNREDVVAQVTAAFLDYEDALVRNDVDRMASWFWRSSATVRYGVAEQLYGFDAIEAWRRTAQPVDPGRRLGRTVVTTFGPDAACVNTEFRNRGGSAVGRQSQVWVRLPEGWQIVSAHVSLA